MRPLNAFALRSALQALAEHNEGSGDQGKHKAKSEPLYETRPTGSAQKFGLSRPECSWVNEDQGHCICPAGCRLYSNGSAEGRRRYGQRIGTVEPVFGDILHLKRSNRLTLRGNKKVRTQWRRYCLVHNIEKLPGRDLKRWRRSHAEVWCQNELHRIDQQAAGSH